MDDKQTTPGLDQVLNSARASAEEQRLNAETLAAQRPQRKQTKSFVVIALWLACAALLIYRLEHVAEPNQWPDLKTSPSIAIASLTNLAEQAEAYKAKNGSYPLDLKQLDLSLGMFHLIDQSTLVYEPGEDRFSIDWTLPNWHAKYDSDTQKTNITATN